MSDSLAHSDPVELQETASGALVVSPQAVLPTPSWSWMRRSWARSMALGFGSGLSPWAPGTMGTLWAWLAFLLIDQVVRWAFSSVWAIDAFWLTVFVMGAVVGTWACTRAAQDLQRADPSCVVWDEIWAFWLILWLITPASPTLQLVAFALFRAFDAIKKGPVGWADRLFKLREGESISWRQGWGIMFDDLIAAACTLLVLAFVVRWTGW